MAEYGEAADMAAELALEDISEGVPSWYRGVAFTILVTMFLFSGGYMSRWEIQ